MPHRFFASLFFIGLLATVVSSAHTQPSLKARLDSADRVVVGEVIFIKAEPTAGPPISEHNPDWYDVVIEVKETLKGKPALVLLVVRFSKSVDVAWYGAPKFSFGQKGVWILQKDASGIYTALHPLDFQPEKEVDNIRTLLQQK